MRATEEAHTEVGRVGVRRTLVDLALKPQPSMGFLKLIEFNMADMSAEALILRTDNADRAIIKPD
jgi:hypothetical protein